MLKAFYHILYCSMICYSVNDIVTSILRKLRFFLLSSESGYQGPRRNPWSDFSVHMVRFRKPNRIDLPFRQFRAATHDIDAARVAEQAVALPGGQFLDDAELLQMAERLVDRGRSDAGLLHQRTRGGDGVLHERPVNLQGGCRRPAEATDLVAVLVRQIEEPLLRSEGRVARGNCPLRLSQNRT